MSVACRCTAQGVKQAGPGHESWASLGLPRRQASLLLPPSKTDKECEGSGFGSERSEPGSSRDTGRSRTPPWPVFDLELWDARICQEEEERA